MPSKISLAGSSVAFAISAVGILAVSAIMASTPCLAQTTPAEGTTSIERGSTEAQKMKETSFQTREERLKAKPLDWNSTTGTPKPLPSLTEEQRKALEGAKPESSGGGQPDPKAEEEARRLHPDDWK